MQYLKYVQDMEKADQERYNKAAQMDYTNHNECVKKCYESIFLELQKSKSIEKACSDLKEASESEE